MNRKVTKLIAFVIIIAMVLTSLSFVFFLPGYLGVEGYVAYGATTSSAEQKKLDEEMSALENYMDYIRSVYKDEVSYQTLIDGAFSGVTNALGDPYSIYYVNDSDSRNFSETVNGDYEGIGVTVENYKDTCRVVSANKFGPADKAGLKSGDIIIKIDGTEVNGRDLQGLTKKLKGPAGTRVSITVLRAGKEITMTAARAKIKAECVAYEMLENKIAYISLAGFDDDADLEFKKARIAMANDGAEAYIIDLRNNPGGLVGMSIMIADQILEDGDIVHFRQQGKCIQTYSATKIESLPVPIVALVNEGTASASEILAGALQDNKAATLVGTTTYGKGVAQELSELKNGGTFKLSTMYFTTPSKREINAIGITPDIVVRNSNGEDTAQLMEKYKVFAPMSSPSKPALGDTDLNVYGAQQRLAFLGYKVEVTGTMDQITVNAVKAFQKESALNPYGTLDYTTMNKLEEVAYNYAAGTSKDDLQMKKALEIINSKIKNTPKD